MSSQPLPTVDPRSRPVTTALRELLDARERKGIETYGDTLRTHNGRSSPRDLVEELIDAAQYGLQWELERTDLLEDLARLKTALEAVRGNAERIKEEARQAAEQYLAERDALRGQLAWCRARLTEAGFYTHVIGSRKPLALVPRRLAHYGDAMPDAPPVTLGEVLGEGMHEPAIREASITIDESLARLKAKIDAAMANDEGISDMGMHDAAMAVGTKCKHCDGCGRLADTESEEPWTAWTQLPLESSMVVAGIVRPKTCHACGGSGRSP